jgi:hypothetical protein
MNPTKWYEESPGVTSSKRIYGGAAMTLGLAMKLALYLVALFHAIPDAATATAQADGFLYSGATLLGITGLDVFKRGA